MDYVLPGIERE